MSSSSSATKKARSRKTDLEPEVNPDQTAEATEFQVYCSFRKKTYDITGSTPEEVYLNILAEIDEGGENVPDCEWKLTSENGVEFNRWMTIELFNELVFEAKGEARNNYLQRTASSDIGIDLYKAGNPKTLSFGDTFTSAVLSWCILGNCTFMMALFLTMMTSQWISLYFVGVDSTFAGLLYFGNCIFMTISIWKTMRFMFRLYWKLVDYICGEHFIIPEYLLQFPSVSKLAIRHSGAIRTVLAAIVIISTCLFAFIDRSIKNAGGTGLFADNAQNSPMVSSFGYVSFWAGTFLMAPYFCLKIYQDVHGVYNGIMSFRFRDVDGSWVNIEQKKENGEPMNSWDLFMDYNSHIFDGWYNKIFFALWAISPIYNFITFAIAEMTGLAMFMGFILPILAYFIEFVADFQVQVHKKRGMDHDYTSLQKTQQFRDMIIKWVSIAVACLAFYLYMQEDMKLDGARDPYKGMVADYPICNLALTNPAYKNDADNNYILTSVDLAILTHMPYADSAAAMKGNLTKHLGNVFCDTDKKNCTDDYYVWQDGAVGLPNYFRLYQKSTKTHLLAIEGTAGLSDVMQDLQIWCAIFTLQQMSFFLPIFQMWSAVFIADVVYAMDAWNVMMYAPAAAYHEEVLDYVLNVARIPLGDEYLIIAGHSLGGAVSGIVAARLYQLGRENVVSFGLSPPGITYSSKMFGVELDTIIKTSIAVVPEQDPVPRCDIQSGISIPIGCKLTNGVSCHFTVESICTIADSCVDVNVQNATYPTIADVCAPQAEGVMPFGF